MLFVDEMRECVPSACAKPISNAIMSRAVMSNRMRVKLKLKLHESVEVK